MPHFFINSKDVNSNVITISDKDNYNHVAKSLRIKIGEKLLLIDENRIQYETIVDKITNSEIITNIEKSYKSNRKLPFNLYLAQSPLMKSDSQNFIVEKATELGVSGIYPIFTDNCALKKSVIENKILKYQKIMYEASKQCERADIPTCFDLTNLNNLLKLQNTKFVAFCERNAIENFHEYYSANPIKQNDNLIVIIGPEGGFSQNEFDILKTNNIPMLTLGDLILKAETAVTVALGNIIYEYNNSKN